jgi:hypothetical protein
MDAFADPECALPEKCDKGGLQGPAKGATFVRRTCPQVIDLVRLRQPDRGHHRAVQVKQRFAEDSSVISRAVCSNIVRSQRCAGVHRTGDASRVATRTLLRRRAGGGRSHLTEFNPSYIKFSTMSDIGSKTKPTVPTNWQCAFIIDWSSFILFQTATDDGHGWPPI